MLPLKSCPLKSPSRFFVHACRECRLSAEDDSFISIHQQFTQIHGKLLIIKLLYFISLSLDLERFLKNLENCQAAQYFLIIWQVLVLPLLMCVGCPGGFVFWDADHVEMPTSASFLGNMIHKTAEIFQSGPRCNP